PPALAPALPVELARMAFVGYGSLTFNSYAKTTLQLAAKPEMRGRVMALWGLAWMGSTPIGGPLIGWIGQEAGARWTLLIGGVPTVICGLLGVPAGARIDRPAGRGPGGPGSPAGRRPPPVRRTPSSSTVRSRLRWHNRRHQAGPDVVGQAG